MLASLLCLEAAEHAAPHVPRIAKVPTNPAVHRLSVSILDSGGISLSAASVASERFAIATSTDVAGASRSLGRREHALVYSRSAWRGDVASPREGI
jgi:hypothetical protein